MSLEASVGCRLGTILLMIYLTVSDNHYGHLTRPPLILTFFFDTSPEPSHNRQVMSPSSPVPIHTSTAAAAADDMHTDSTIRLRAITQLDIPIDVLLSFQQNLSEDLGFMQDISAAVQELSDRAQHRTSILGTALENTGRAVLDLQTGQEALRSGMEQLQAKMLRQQQILVAITQHGKEAESKSAQHEKDIQMLKEHLEANHHQQQASQLQLDCGVQLQAALAARAEQLEGQAQRLSLATEPQCVKSSRHSSIRQCGFSGNPGRTSACECLT